MLVVALVVVIGGGVLLAVLAFLVRSDSGVVRLDRSVADWGQRHASSLTDDVLNTITFVVEPNSVAVLAVLVAVAATLRTRNRWIVPFMFVVVAGTGVLTTTVKELADRARPALNPIAETLGPSFPSGHSSWSAAFLAATALILSRNRGPHARALLAGVAAGLAMTIAATRVLLAVHWLSDVIAGLALGWAWFTVCAVAFGGRVLRFGAGVERVQDEAEADPRAPASAPSTRASSGLTPRRSATSLTARCGESCLTPMVVVGTAAAITSARRSAATSQPARSTASRCSSVSVIGTVTK